MTDSILRSFSYQSQTTQVPFPVTFGPLLDSFPGAAVAYSFRKLRTAYAGSAVRIRRSSDNAEQDVGFVGNDFDTASAASFIGGGTGFIAKWYDQGTNAIHMPQVTAGQQPTYVATSSINSSKPAMQVDGTGRCLQLGAFTINGATIWSGADFCSFVVVWVDSTGGVTQYFWAFYDSTNTPFRLNYLFNSGNISSTAGNGSGHFQNVAQPGNAFNTKHLYQLYRDTSNNQAIVQDNSVLLTESGITDSPTGGSAANSITEDIMNIANSGFMKGFMTELVLYPNDLGANRSGAAGNINGYWSIY